MCNTTVYIGKTFTVSDNKLIMQGLNGDVVKFQSSQIRKIESGFNFEMKWVLTITSMKGNSWEYRFDDPRIEALNTIFNWWKGEIYNA